MRRRVVCILPVLTVFSLLSACGGGSSTTKPVIPPFSVTIIPTRATTTVGGTVQFSALVSGSTNHSVTWQVNGTAGGDATRGTIDANGIYTAPSAIPSPATLTVTAVPLANPSKASTASVTITFEILPAAVSLPLRDAQCTQPEVGMQQFTASGATSPVTWSVAGRATGNPDTTFGSIDADGLYTAPQVWASPPSFNVTATSQSDAAQTASAHITISSGSPATHRLSQAVPIALGTSGGNIDDHTASFCCSGTLGALVRRNGTNYILSNSHVLARSGSAQPGEPIGQPGLVDNACSPGTSVANLSQAVKLQSSTSGAPAVDAAIAEVVDGQVDPSGAIIQLGDMDCGVAKSAPPANTTVAPALGMPVAKSGRTSGLTCGAISAINVDITVRYDNACGSSGGFNVNYTNQVEIDGSSFAAAGDSGSLIVDADTAQPVALLFAGDSTFGATFANPIADVLGALIDPTDKNKTQPRFVGGSPHPVSVCTGTATNTTVGLKSSAASVLSLASPELSRAKSAKKAHVAELLADPAVLGVGIGAGAAPGKAAIVIFVQKGKTAKRIPSTLDGVATRVKVIGPVHALSAACHQSEDQQSQLDLLR